MRLGFFGKGGAGKTTTAAGFAKYLSKRVPYILAIDADVNIHLRSALDWSDDSSEQIDLGDKIKEVAEYVKGGRTDLGTRPLISSTPPSMLSQFIRVHPNDPFIVKYGSTQDNISLLTVGTYNQEDVGASCYHSKLGSLAILFHHLLDGAEDYVIADTNAGIDNVATSLAFAYDMNVFVVEPTKKSLGVYKDYIALAKQLSERTFVIANKVDGAKDRDFLLEHIDSDKLLGTIPHSKYLKSFEQGAKDALPLFEAEQKSTFDKLLAKWKASKKDWPNYLSTLKAVHEKNSSEWYDAYYGVCLAQGLDSDFEYERVIAKNVSIKESVLVS